MIRGNYLDSASRVELLGVVRDARAPQRVARRANALLLLDDGLSCKKVAEVLYLDDDTVRYWHGQYQEKGFGWLEEFGYAGRACALSPLQQEALKDWVGQTLPASTLQIGEWLEQRYQISYQRAGLVKLLGRLGLVYTRPRLVPRTVDPDKQAAFIKGYNALLDRLDEDEAVLFADAVHPTHAARPAGCWGPQGTPLALAQHSGRERLNIHGAIDLESGKTCIIDVACVDADSTLALLSGIEALFPAKRRIHVFVDNARYHHARRVRDWLKRPGRRIKLHFIPPYCPHLDPIERLWGCMHKHVTHNRSYEKFTQFCTAILTFLRDDVPKNWHKYCDSVTDNFRVINYQNIRVLKA